MANGAVPLHDDGFDFCAAKINAKAGGKWL
jgi:hypothetical protein